MKIKLCKKACFLIAFAVLILANCSDDLEPIERPKGNSSSSSEASSSSIEKDSFTDSRDGKVYKYVKIGEQYWMAENVNYEVAGNCNNIEAKSACYNNDLNNCNAYGRLYDLNTASCACPDGWFLPGKSEWNGLINYIGGGEAVEKTKIMAESEGGTDDYGFTALLSGYGDLGGVFWNLGSRTYWWGYYEEASSYSLTVTDTKENISLELSMDGYLNSVRCYRL